VAPRSCQAFEPDTMGGSPSVSAVTAAPASAVGQALGTVTERVRQSYRSDYLRAEPYTLYSTLEDFMRADPSLKRVVALGLTGCGKSTLLNVTAGWEFVQSSLDHCCRFRPRQGREPLFKPSEVSRRSETKKLAFARVDWFGQSDKPLYVIDTPGPDDSEVRDLARRETRELLRRRATDIHNKLKALGHVDLILILHSDPIGMRLTQPMYELLRLVDEKFRAGGRPVWDHVAVAFTRCNEVDSTWRRDLAKKRMEMQQGIRDETSCTVDVPVFFLGGLQPERHPARPRAGPSEGRSRSRSRSPLRGRDPGANSSVTISEFDKLWQLISQATPLDTSDLQPFHGADVQWERMLRRQDELEAEAKAARIYLGVVARLAVLLAFLYWRASMVPDVVGRLLLNLMGPFDEVCIILFLVFWIGPSDVFFSLRHAYRTWLQPLCGDGGVPQAAAVATSGGHQHQD